MSCCIQALQLAKAKESCNNQVAGADILQQRQRVTVRVQLQLHFQGLALTMLQEGISGL